MTELPVRTLLAIATRLGRPSRNPPFFILVDCTPKFTVSAGLNVKPVSSGMGVDATKVESCKWEDVPLSPTRLGVEDRCTTLLVFSPGMHLLSVHVWILMSFVAAFP